MAPPNAAAELRRVSRGRNGPRSVVPAIPLPHMKRKAAAEAAAAVATAAATKAQSSPGGDVQASDSTTTNDERRHEMPTADPAAPHVGGKSKVHSAELVVSPVRSRWAELEARTQQLVIESPTASTEFEVPSANTPDPALPAQPASGSIQNLPNGSVTPSELSSVQDNAVVASEPNQTVPPPYSIPHHHHYQGNFVLNPLVDGDVLHMPHPAPNGRAHIHQSHPSNSSIHFGAFHDSAASSPAPPLSAGIAPPPGMALPGLRQPYMSHPANGFPSAMAPGPDALPMGNFDAVGRPTGPYVPAKPLNHAANGYPPSTPQSFHGSQSSNYPEENGVHHQAPGTTPHTVGVASPGHNSPQHHPGRSLSGFEYPPGMVPYHGPPPGMIPHDDGDGLSEYIRHQFDAHEFADCLLKLRYGANPEPGLIVPGHRIVFARSPLLHKLIRRATAHTTQTPLMIIVQTNNRWIRNDTFYMAVQRLYGHRLLPGTPPGVSSDLEDLSMAGSQSERLRFALSYAAAGHLLGWGVVVKRGMEVAADLLSLECAEEVLDFALTDCRDSNAYNEFAFEEFPYGEGSRLLLDRIVALVANNLSPNFRFDASAADVQGYARVPYNPPSDPATADIAPEAVATEDTSPPVGTQGRVVTHLGKTIRSQNHPKIQFGDLSVPNGVNGGSVETPKASQPIRLASHAVISRILVNLPFTCLKMLLEAGFGHANGWASMETRYRVVQDAVKEREKRRLQAFDAVKKGQIPEAASIRAGLQNPEPQPMGQWSALGWQEQVKPPGGAEGPSLQRQWVPLKDHAVAAANEYP